MIVRFVMFGAAAAMSWSSSATANEVAIDGIVPGAEAISQVPDNEFQQLFASWAELEEGGRVTATGEILAAPRFAVSIPSLMPVEGVKFTSGYGMRNHPVLRQRRHHNGVDLAAPMGTPVYATADGIITEAKYWSSYGNYVEIQHGGSLETRYAHLQDYTVHAGDAVKKGDLIGYVGSTGRSTGPHLHYEVRVEGSPVNPLPYMITELAMADERDEQAARGGPE